MVEIICDTNFLIHLATKRIKNIDNIDVEKELKKLMNKGLIVQNEKRVDGLHRIPVWDLTPDVAKRMGEEKKGLFGMEGAKPAKITVTLK